MELCALAAEEQDSDKLLEVSKRSANFWQKKSSGSIKSSLKIRRDSFSLIWLAGRCPLHPATSLQDAVGVILALAIKLVTLLLVKWRCYNSNLSETPQLPGLH
jgi:hypothetical protein